MELDRFGGLSNRKPGGTALRAGRGSSWRGNRVYTGPIRSSNAVPEPALGNMLEILQIHTLQPHPNVKAEITECDYIASFNWLDEKEPTMVVPGMPPTWTPLELPKQLRPDSGDFFRDINAAHYAKHPIEPAVRAVLLQRPELLTKDIDIFACGSTIGHLLRFVRGSNHVFRFVVELIGETVFFIRREKSPTEKIEGVLGYGHTFPENYTKYDESVQRSDSHQRLIQYDFAGFKCIIRYEGDGYLANEVGQYSPSGQLASLPELEGLRIKRAGKEIPQHAIFDLKTRSAWKQTKVLQEELPRLWVRQIPNFILAYHESGTFNDIRVQNICSELSAWEKEHKSDLGKLAALIARIVKRARDSGGDRFEVCCRTSRDLELRHVGGDFPHALAEDLRRMWGGDNDCDVSSGDEDELHVHDSGTESDNAESDSNSEPDYTACSTDCGYCGRCKY